MVGAYGTSTAEKPDKYNVIVVTNFAYHYFGKGQSGASERVAIVSLHPKYALASSDLLTEVIGAVDGYGQVPEQ